ncbi:ABC transporter ATP-binding protein [Bacillus sp. 03113]|uniref:ABC transporter ATP-binding protein n=1 Tax=Bacillus sp. 03113 TaxID=2578211 RepID=UPI001142EAE0|nr:ABC transporter ATP-binding protein [Bacillus sp. 03113]
MNKVITLQNISKKYKESIAVEDISFSIKKGEITAILGPNGAGKTTTISMMLGLLKPTNGSVKVFNLDPTEKKVREKIGAMLQEVSVMDGLKVIEIIKLFRSYYPNPFTVEELCQYTGLEEVDLKKRTNKLSGGQKRRLEFALALAGNPDILFLDEPTVGMDIHSRRLFWNTLHELKQRGKTIIFTTHYLQEADDSAERIILIHKGKVAAEGSPIEIKRKLSKQSVSFLLKGNIGVELFEEFPYVSEVYTRKGRTYLVTDQTDHVLSLLFERKLSVSDIQVEQGKLEEAFEQLTERKEIV